jgi:hypothetical protein
MTPSGIDPATFRFVAQCLNNCATACPEAYLNKTDYDTVQHDSWRNFNILHTVTPNDITKSVSEESTHNR